MSDIVTLARRHKHVAPTHYEGCEVDHIGCLVNRLADEIEGLRAENERLRKVYVLIATESAGIVEGGSIFEDKIAGCYASHQSADKAGENLGYVNWRIEEHTIISKALEGKP